MPKSSPLAELNELKNDTIARAQHQIDFMEQLRAGLAPLSPVVEGSLAASDLPTQYNIPAIQPAIRPPVTLPMRPATAPAVAHPTQEDQPSPPRVEVVTLFKYKHHNIRSSLGEQIEAALEGYSVAPGEIYISPYCKTILSLMSWGDTYYYRGYTIALLPGNWLADDEVALYGNQGPWPTAETLPAWLSYLEKEEEACGIGGNV